jgi:uncharacterized protein YyaL (SSP411 family)
LRGLPHDLFANLQRSNNVPAWKRPSFAIVSHTLLALSVLGFAINALRPSIPPIAPNRLRYETADFLLQGSRSGVDWRPLEPAAFSLARRTGKTVLLLVGTPWSKAARDADAHVFTDREVVSFLNRYFICLRMDGQAQPRWLSSFLPLRRRSLPLATGFQLWFLTPEGELFEEGTAISGPRAAEPATLMQILRRVRETRRLIQAGGIEAPVPGSEQEADHQLLTQPSFPVPIDENGMLAEFLSDPGLRFGGITRHGRVRMAPNALHYLLLSGRTNDFRAIADALVSGPLVDWLDGGFYRSYAPQDSLAIEFDKLALPNAEAMAVLARAGAVLDQPTYRLVAERAFDSLSGEFIHFGLVAGSRTGDEAAMGRSRRNSFPPKRLRELLSPDERALARSELGLEVERNPVLAVRIARPERLLQPDSPLAAIISKLRAGRPGEAAFAGKRLLDVHGYVTARLIEAARVWNDEERLRQADQLYSRLEWFLAGNDVRHTLDPGIDDTPFLGDYLAFADAALQHYLAFGRRASFEKGLRVLQRARTLFETGAPGVWKLPLSRPGSLGPRHLDVPEALDVVRESCTAMAIRLCSSYGRILLDSSEAREAEATALLQASQSAIGQISALLPTLGVEGAATLCAIARVADVEYAIVSGQDRVAAARRLYARAPGRLVAPRLEDENPAGGAAVAWKRDENEARLSEADAAARIEPLPPTSRGGPNRT